MSMTVEKSTADDVRKKFESLQKTKNQPAPVDTVLDGEHLSHAQTRQHQVWPVLLLLAAKATCFCTTCNSFGSAQ